MNFTPKKWLCMMRFRLILAIVSLLAITSCGCTQKAEKTVPPSNGDFVRMTNDIQVPTDLLTIPVPISVLLPKSYLSEPERRYSVVYMLHGLGDNPQSWNDSWLRVQSTIESLEDAGLGDMIYVFPSGYKTYYCNRIGGGYPYMDMFINELIPFVDNAYRTIPDREHRAVTGYSMGGFGACALALKHPEMFIASAPLSMSFRTDQQYMTEEQSGWDGQWGKIFGGRGETGQARLTDYYKEHCPFYQFTAANKEKVSGVHWYFTCGDNEEQLLIAGDALHVQMRDAGIEHEYRVGDGGHEGSYWRAALKEVLPMFDHDMNGATIWKDQAEKIDIQPLSFDKAFVSKHYSAGDGCLVLLAHSGLDKTTLGKIMAAMDKSDYNKAFVLYPCDLSQKMLSAWAEEAKAAYPTSKLICVTVGADGSPALDMAGEFERTIFIDSSFSVNPSLTKGQKVFFACAEDAANYAGMNALYNACKASEATFEYRVLQSSGDTVDNWARSIKSIISTFLY